MDESISSFAIRDRIRQLALRRQTPTELKDLTGKCLVNNVNIAIMIENLFFYANNSMELATSSRMMDEHNIPTL